MTACESWAKGADYPQIGAYTLISLIAQKYPPEYFKII